MTMQCLVFEFPPVNSGGLIEALSGDAGEAAATSRMFPPVNSGGLIEAMASSVRRVTWRWLHLFPPVNSGGLIEASVLLHLRLEARITRFRR